MAVSTLAAVAAGTGGMLALQAPAHATETGTNGLIASWTVGGTEEEYADGSGAQTYSIPYGVGITPDEVVWSSDGSRVAWVTTKGNLCGIYTSAPDLTGAVALPATSQLTCREEVTPTWFDDNTSIVFEGDGYSPQLSGPQLYVQPIAGPGSGAPTLLYPDAGFFDEYPRAVGDLVAFTHHVGPYQYDTPQVWIYDKALGTAHMVVDNAQYADISPDGKSLVFVRPGSGELFTANIDGSDVTQLTNTGGNHSQPVWSPDGTMIAFSDSATSHTSVVDVATKIETLVPGSGGVSGWQPVNAQAPVPPPASPETTPSTTPATTPSTTPSTAPSTLPSTPPTTPSSTLPSTTPSTTPSTSPSTTPPPPPPAKPMVQRVAGSDRFDTGVKISRQVWSDGTDNSAGALRAQAVVLATGASFPDALAGGPLAAVVGGPLLLTDSTSLPSETLQEIQRVLPAFSGKTIYILGKYGAVSQGVENELRSMGYNITRLGGNDRFETSRIIATEFARHVAPPADGSPAPVVLATGTTYADALPAGPLATLIGAPIVLTNGPVMDEATYNFVGVRPVLPVGGPAYKAAGLVPDPQGDACADLAGADRYSTSAFVANCIGELRGLAGIGPSAFAGVATGLNYPDALTGGALMGLVGGPLLLTDPQSLSPQAASELENARQNLQLVSLFGGTGALAPLVEQQAVAAIGGVDLKPLFSGLTVSGGALSSAVATVEKRDAAPASRTAMAAAVREVSE